MLILGHRGYSAKFVENTIKSIIKAFEYGADGIECDLQKIGSDNFVIFHDSDLLRMANIDKELLKCDKKSIEIIRINGEEKIPFLEELLEIIPKDKIINFEIKRETITIEDCHKISLIIKDKVNIENIIISSFEHSFLSVFKKYGFKIGMIVGGKEKKRALKDFFLNIFKIDSDYIILSIDIFKMLGEKKILFLLNIFKLIGKKLIFWNVNDDKYLDKIKGYADIIITDNVELLIELIRGI